MLKNLANEQLILNLKSLVHDERRQVVQILDYLREVEVRGLHLARGYSSMFSFCTECLGYSESEAHIRIQAMRLSKEISEVSGHIEADIPSSIRRQVWLKAKGQCTYVDQQTGRQCVSRHALEIDHLHGFAKGGKSTLENLTLLCAAHNKFKGVMNCDQPPRRS